MLQDTDGMTPLHVLFDVAIQQDDWAWDQVQRNKTVRDSVDLRNGGGGYCPPTGLLELLLRHTSKAGANDERPPCAAQVEGPQGQLPLHLVVLTATRPEVVQMLIQAHPTALVHTTDNLQTHLHDALIKPYSTMYRMLESNPEGTLQSTTVKGHNYTPLDLHEMRKSTAEDVAKWMNIRELFFTFGPTLFEHRSKGDLLEQCANLIRDEVEGKGSLHCLTEYVEWKKRQREFPDLELMKTLSAIEAPKIDRGYKPKRNNPNTSRAPKVISPVAGESKPASAIKKNQKKEDEKKEKKSVYDDDAVDLRYVLSNDNLGDDYSFDKEFRADEENNSFDGDENDDFDEEDIYTYDSRTFDNTVDSRTLGSRRTMGSNESAIRKGEEDDVTMAATDSSSPSGTPNPDKFEEEKKEEDVSVPFLSNVALRLWTSFVLYYNPKDPRDNYSKCVEMIVEEISFSSVRQLISLPLPAFAEKYVSYGARGNHDTTRSLLTMLARRSFIMFHTLLVDTSFDPLHKKALSCTAAMILNHPFFALSDKNIKNRDSVIQQIVAHRERESAAYMRSLQRRNAKQAEGGWVTTRSKILHCWSYFAMRMHLAPSTLLWNGILGAPDLPFGVLLLSSKLAKNKSGKSTPSTKKDVEKSEKMRIQLLGLIKLVSLPVEWRQL